MREVDILVVGAGPGGMSAAQYASRAGYSTLVLDPMGPGGQLYISTKLKTTRDWERPAVIFFQKQWRTSAKSSA